MPKIVCLNNDLSESVLIQFAKNDTYDHACRVLNALARDWNMRFVKDNSPFGGYYIRADGFCYSVK